MKETLESAAAPRREEMIAELRINSHLTMENGLKLDELIRIEKCRSDFDVATHDQWKEAKKKAAHATWMQVFIGIAALAVAMGGLYSGAIELNRDNPAIIMMHDAYKEIEKVF